MLIVVSYDVPEDRRRTGLANDLKDFGARVQYSVFECVLSHDQLEALRKRLLRRLDLAEDRLRIYALCEECRAKVEVHGSGERTEDPEVYVL
jgi:CRISPR-associated protein Cas2